MRVHQLKEDQFFLRLRKSSFSPVTVGKPRRLEARLGLIKWCVRRLSPRFRFERDTNGARGLPGDGQSLASRDSEDSTPRICHHGDVQVILMPESPLNAMRSIFNRLQKLKGFGVRKAQLVARREADA